jgi:hypothetical protein
VHGNDRAGENQRESGHRWGMTNPTALASTSWFGLTLALALASLPSACVGNVDLDDPADDSSGSVTTNADDGASMSSTDASSTLSAGESAGTTAQDEGAEDGSTDDGADDGSDDGADDGTTGVTECSQLQITEPLYALRHPKYLDRGIFQLTGEWMGDPDLRDSLRLEFHVPDTGMFDLGEESANYDDCDHCVLLREDRVDFQPTHVYFQSTGTIDVDPDSELIGTSMSAVFSGVRLVEVTFDDDNNSTPLPGGGCVDIVDATITGIPVPEAWTCEGYIFGDYEGCECGCGLVDTDCLDASVAACDSCGGGIGGCGDPEDFSCPGIIDPRDNAACTE